MQIMLYVVNAARVYLRLTNTSSNAVEHRFRSDCTSTSGKVPYPPLTSIKIRNTVPYKKVIRVQWKAISGILSPLRLLRTVYSVTYGVLIAG